MSIFKKKKIEGTVSIGKIKVMGTSLDQKLSPRFTLRMMIRSQTAARHGINNHPNKEEIENLRALCNDVLEPIFDYIDKEYPRDYKEITSGFRCDALNKKLRGSRTSEHKDGKAADIDIPGKDLTKLFEWIVLYSGLDFNQCIYEFGEWIHISYKREGTNSKIITVSEKVKIAPRKYKTEYIYYSKEEIRRGIYK